MRIFLVFLIIFIFISPVYSSDYLKDKYRINVEETLIKTLEIDPVYVSLDECLLIALENNYNLKSEKALLNEKIYQYKYAWSSLLPDVEVRGYSTIYTGQILVGAALVDEINETALFGAVKFSHDLTKGGYDIFEILSKKRLKLSATAKYNDSIENLLYETAICYYKLLQAKIDIETYLINLNDRKYQYEISNARYEVGDTDKLDVVRTDIEVHEAKSQLLDSLSDYRACMVKLSNVMGVSIDSNLVPIETEIKTYELIEKELTSEALYNNAVESLNSLQTLKEEIKSLKLQRNQYLSEIIPKIDVFAQLSMQGTVKLGVRPNTTAGIEINIPLGDNLFVGTIMKMKAMDEKIKSKEALLEQRKRDIYEEIKVDYSLSKKNIAKIALLELDMKDSDTALEIASGKYFEGEGILLDVFQAQNKKLLTKTNLSKVKVEYNISQIQLLYHSNLMTVNNLLKGYKP